MATSSLIDMSWVTITTIPLPENVRPSLTLPCHRQHLNTVTMSTHCRLMLLFVLSAALLSSCFTIGGPARSFALVAARAAKIPRSIRAPFSNAQMMTARGFGKRSQTAGIGKRSISSRTAHCAHEFCQCVGANSPDECVCGCVRVVSSYK